MVSGRSRGACRACAQIEKLKPLEWVEIPILQLEGFSQNYSECYHCSLNHPTFATGIVKPETYDIRPQGYCLRHTTECQNLQSMSYPIDLESNPYAGVYSSGSCGRCSRSVYQQHAEHISLAGH